MSTERSALPEYDVQRATERVEAAFAKLNAQLKVSLHVEDAALVYDAIGDLIIASQDRMAAETMAMIRELRI